MVELVAFGRFLIGTTQSIGTFDFSLAIAVSDWVRHNLRDVREEGSMFSDVVRAVETLQDVVSLKRGVGLAKLWTELSNAIPAIDDECLELQYAEKRLRPSNENKSTSTYELLDGVS